MSRLIMMFTLALGLTVGLAACAIDDEEPIPAPHTTNGPPPDAGPDEPNVPGPDDDTCGGNQLRADGTCSPGDR